MNEIRWEDPPPDGRGPVGAAHKELRDELIRNPGRWAIWMERDKRQTLGRTYSRVTHSQHGWKGYRWEAKTRVVDGTARLYVRCLGPLDGAS
jgi:hypothetical protein